MKRLFAVTLFVLLSVLLFGNCLADGFLLPNNLSFGMYSDEVMNLIHDDNVSQEHLNYQYYLGYGNLRDSFSADVITDRRYSTNIWG